MDFETPPRSQPGLWILPDAVWSGFLVGLGLHAAVVSGLLALQAWMPVIAIGLAQLLWLLPLGRYLKGRGSPSMAKGVFILLGLTLLLNATCFGVVLYGELR